MFFASSKTISAPVTGLIKSALKYASLPSGVISTKIGKERPLATVFMLAGGWLPLNASRCF
jgi:hypothetical protein